MPPLQRAVALEEVHDDRRARRRRSGLRCGAAVRSAARRRARRRRTRARLRCRAAAIASSSSSASRTMRMPLPPPPAAALSSAGKPTRVQPPRRCRASVCDRRRRARHDRHAGRRHGRARAGLRSHPPHHGRGRSDEDRGRPLSQRVGERAILGEEPVAGMHRVGAGPPRGVDDARDVQVALVGRRRADRHRLVGFARRAARRRRRRSRRRRSRCPSRGTCG